MASLSYWIWLSSAEISPRAKTALLEQFGDPEQAFFAPEGALTRLPGVSAQEGKLLEKRDLSRVNPILGACEEQHLQIVTLQDAAYPHRLRNI